VSRLHKTHKMRVIDHSKIFISYIYKSKAKVVPVHGQRRGIAPLSLNLGTKWR
jgi:hypothetical protein